MDIRQRAIAQRRGPAQLRTAAAGITEAPAHNIRRDNIFHQPGKTIKRQQIRPRRRKRV